MTPRKYHIPCMLIYFYYGGVSQMVWRVSINGKWPHTENWFQLGVLETDGSYPKKIKKEGKLPKGESLYNLIIMFKRWQLFGSWFAWSNINTPSNPCCNKEREENPWWCKGWVMSHEASRNFHACEDINMESSMYGSKIHQPHGRYFTYSNVFIHAHVELIEN